MSLRRATLHLMLLPACIAGLSLAATAQPRPEQKPNVLLITVDTFRPDHVGAYGYDRETTPALDRLAGDGVVFTNAISSSSWTTPGLLSGLTGLWAPTHGVDVRGKSLREGTGTMATLLRQAGYAAPDILYLSSLPNFQNLGLTTSYADRDRYLPSGDEVLFKALEAYQDSTFFLYYHYRNLHLPYNPTPPYDRMFTPRGFDRSGFVKDKVDVVRRNVTVPLGSVVLSDADRDWVVGLYDGSVREMDETFFGPLVDTLKRLGLYEKTLTIVTADHGEELMDHGYIGHPSTSFKGSVYDEVIRIPLVMTCPFLLPGDRTVGAQVRVVDVLPTVLDLLGRPVSEGLQGRSLLAHIQGEQSEDLPAFVETTPGGYQATPEMMKTRIRAMRLPPWKLIRTQGPGVDRYELFDLGEDPEERRDVAGSHPDVVDRMRTDLHRWVLGAQPVSPGPTIAPKEQAVVATAPIDVLFPADGDTFLYADAGKAVSVRWRGPEDVVYTIEYRVGEGNYHVEGSMRVPGTSGQYGPYTEEMWNMLCLYNPWAFRVTIEGQAEVSSPWVRFVLMPTESTAAPDWTALVGVALMFWWHEAALLVTGIGVGLLHLLRLVSAFSAVDLVSVGLGVAIVAGLLQPYAVRLGSERVWRWGAVLLYTGFIYATLSVMPRVWGALWGYTQGRVDYVGTMVAVLVGFGLCLYLALRCRRLLPFLLVPPVGTVYALLLANLGRSPAERLHLAEYGLLSLLVFLALRIDMPRRRAYLWGWAIAAVLGTIDEGIQWLLPSRVFELKDIGLNILCSGLGMLVVALLHDAQRDPG